MKLSSSTVLLSILLMFIDTLTLVTSPTSAVSIEEQCGTGRLTSRHRQPRLGRGPGRLVGGYSVLPGQFPWQVTLQLRHPRWGFVGHWCAGVLVHPNWVLTGGHCVTNRLFNLPRPNYWTVVLGKYNLRMKEPSEVVRKVSRIIIHEEFREYHNDLALIKLAQPLYDRDTNRINYNANTTSTEPIARNGFIGTICLPDTELTINETYVGLKCVATGWGRSHIGGHNSEYLQRVEMPIVSNEVCQRAYDKHPVIPIHDYHICAGYLDGGKGTCIGDSGGPLQCPVGDGRWFLVGLTSFGSGCAKPRVPDVFTRITYYLNWIKNNIRTM